MSKAHQSSTLLLIFFCGVLLLLGQEYLSALGRAEDYAFGVVFALLLGLTAALGLRWKRPWLSLAVGAIVLAIICGRGQDLFLLREPLTALWPLVLSLLASELTKRCVRIKWYRFGLCYGLYFLATFVGGFLLLLHPVEWHRFEPVRAVWLILTADAALWSVSLKDDYTDQICKLMPIATAPGPSKQLQSMVINLSIRDKYLKQTRLIWTIGTNLAALGLLCFQSRVQAILRNGVGLWLVQRWEMLTANLAGHTDAVGTYFEGLLPLRCPLSHIHSVSGPWPVLLILALTAAVFALMAVILHQLPDRRVYKTLCRGLLLCLLLKTLLALAAEFLLIHSTQLELPLLSSPWDLTTLAMFLLLSSSPDERSILVSAIERSYSS